MDVEVNFLAVILAAVSTMIVGSTWYSPAVFGKTWAKLARVDIKKTGGGQGMAATYGMVIVASLVSAYVLAHVTFLSNSFFKNSWMQDALSTGFWVWLGFVAARMLTHELFEDRPKKLFAINAAHELVTFMVMALIIGLFKP